MSWREDLRRVSVGGRQLIGASFRGVPFFVESSELAGGRRAVVHEFPLRDDPFVEDLGRHARTFRIDGYVIGDDYLVQRDALLAALEDEEGPGELVHPYHGVRRAICVNVSVRESRAEGGMATFSLEFAETPTQAPAPTAVVDAPEQVAGSADVAITATQAEFEEKYDTSGLPAFSIESAETALADAVEAISDALAPIVSDTQELAEFTGRISLLTARVSSLVRQPPSVLGEFRDAIVGLVKTVAAAPGDVMDALIDAYSVDLGVEVLITTAKRAREAENQFAITGALRRVLAIEAARLAPLVAYDTVDDAIASRNRIAALLEEQAANADDAAYPALVDLRSELLRAVPGGSAFARAVTVTRNAQIPLLLLSYQLYGSVDQESDIAARNGIRHPGFVAGDLKVLGNA